MAKRSRITIRDVAEAAGTSPSTVSRVLTGSARVSPAKREAVQRAIEALNFSPSLLARSLKTKLSYNLGLIVGDIESSFYMTAAKGLQDHAAGNGYTVMLCDTGGDPAKERLYLQMLLAKGLDGIAFVPTGGNLEFIASLLVQGARLVQIDRALDGIGASAVLVDSEAGAYAAVCHLIDQGYRRIALVNFDYNVTTDVGRQQGYLRAMATHDLPVPAGFIRRGRAAQEDGYRLTLGLLAMDPRPDALFAASGRLGVGAFRAIKDRDLRIPDDIALAVFDDLELFTLVTPAVTAVQQPEYEMGWEASKLLMQAIEAEDLPRPRQVVLETRLIVRQSSQPRPSWPNNN